LIGFLRALKNIWLADKVYNFGGIWLSHNNFGGGMAQGCSLNTSLVHIFSQADMPDHKPHHIFCYTQC